ncbi:MAG: PqqD family protein [Acidobacteria bacterium]|nr:MAG: PqqD family protein [Acidobacteriota bacterium]
MTQPHSTSGDAAGVADRVYEAHPEASFTRLGDDGLVVVPRGAWNLVVNETAIRVLELLDGRRTVGEIADIVAEEYEGADRDTILQDLVEVLEDLARRGAVRRAGP